MILTSILNKLILRKTVIPRLAHGFVTYLMEYGNENSSSRRYVTVTALIGLVALTFDLLISK